MRSACGQPTVCGHRQSAGTSILPVQTIAQAVLAILGTAMRHQDCSSALIHPLSSPSGSHHPGPISFGWTLVTGESSGRGRKWLSTRPSPYSPHGSCHSMRRPDYSLLAVCVTPAGHSRYTPSAGTITLGEYIAMLNKQPDPLNADVFVEAVLKHIE